MYRAPTACPSPDALIVEAQSIKVEFSIGKKAFVRRVIHVGHEYRIEPHNPAKLRNRNRECRVLGFTHVSSSHGEVVARVRFLDNNRQGRAELSELVPLTGSASL
jgi:hypothetical protein